MPDYSVVESENAELLQDIIDGETSYTKDTHSRNAEILKSIINGTEYDEEPQSEIEELLLELKNHAGGGDLIGKFIIDESGDTKILTGVCADDMTISGVDSVADSSFRYILIKNITIEEGVISLGNYVFSENTALEEISLPSTLETIGGYAFKNDSKLKGIDIPNKVKAIPESCFYNCTSLGSVTYANDITSIGASAFYGTAIKGISIPSSVTSIGGNCFQNSKLESVDLSNYAQSTISDSLFYNCKMLESAILPTSISALPNNLLRGCSSLKTIDIPSNVTTLGSNTFWGCTSLESVTIRCSSEVTVSNIANTFNSVPADCAIYVPSDLVDTYKASSKWSSRAEYIQAIPA